MASSCRNIGVKIGRFISTSVFVNLSYYKLLNLSSYFLTVSVIFFVATIVTFFIKEENTESKINPPSLPENIGNIKNIFMNPNVRKLVFIIMLSQIGTIFFIKTSVLVLKEKGISKEFISNISFSTIFIELIVSYYLNKKNEKFLLNFLNGFGGLIFVCVLEFIFYESVEYLDKLSLIFIFIILSTLRAWLGLFWISGLGGFFNKICDDNIGASYITALNTVNNLSKRWPGFFIYALVDYLGYRSVAVLSILYNFFYFFTFEKSLKNLDLLDKKEWSGRNKIKVEESNPKKIQ